jgi:hypothetical protein
MWCFPVLEGQQRRFGLREIKAIDRARCMLPLMEEVSMEAGPAHSHTQAPSWRRTLIGTPTGWVLTLIIAAVGVYLLLYHLDHTLLAVPYLLLVACPLLHLFMHHGHIHGDGLS